MNCSKCGASENLTERNAYQGGVGYVWFTECRDAVACQRRHDAQMREDTARALDRLLALEPV